MSKLNEHQVNLWKTMIKLIEDYLENKIEFRYLVNSLEGLIDASEIKNKEVVKEWYSHWGPLEMINAETEITISSEEKNKTAQEMKEYLQDFLET